MSMLEFASHYSRFAMGLRADQVFFERHQTIKLLFRVELNNSSLQSHPFSHLITYVHPLAMIKPWKHHRLWLFDSRHES